MVNHDRRGTLLDAYENAAVIVSGIDPEDLGHPTPCRKYDVAGLVDHIVEAGHRAAALGRGQTPPPGEDSPHVGLADAPGQLRHGAEDAAQAWGDDSRLLSKLTMPWGEEYTGATLVEMYLAELAAHAWDLARATGQIDELDPSLAVAALEGARHDQTRVPRHGGTWISVRKGSAAAAGRRRLGTPRRLHGTRPASTAGPAGVRRRGAPNTLVLDVGPHHVVDTGYGWEVSQAGVGAVMVVRVQPGRQGSRSRLV